MLSARLRHVSFAAACFSCLTLACKNGSSTSATNEATSPAAAATTASTATKPVNPCKTAQLGNALGQTARNAIMNETSGCITAIFTVDEYGQKDRVVADQIEIAPMGKAYFTDDLGAFGVEITNADGSKVELNSLANGLANSTGTGQFSRSKVYNGMQPDDQGFNPNFVSGGQSANLNNRPWTMIRTLKADFSAKTSDPVNVGNTYFVAGAGGGGGGGGGGGQGKATAVLNDGSRVTRNVGGSGQQAGFDQNGQYAPQQNDGTSGQFAQDGASQDGAAQDGGFDTSLDEDF